MFMQQNLEHDLSSATSKGLPITKLRARPLSPGDSPSGPVSTASKEAAFPPGLACSHQDLPCSQTKCTFPPDSLNEPGLSRSADIRPWLGSFNGAHMEVGGMPIYSPFAATPLLAEPMPSQARSSMKTGVLSNGELRASKLREEASEFRTVGSQVWEGCLECMWAAPSALFLEVLRRAPILDKALPGGHPTLQVYRSCVDA